MAAEQLITLLQMLDPDAEVLISDQSIFYGVVGGIEHDWASPHPEGYCLAFRHEKDARFFVRLGV